MSVVAGAGRFEANPFGRGSKQAIRYDYDFAVDGGAVSAIPLRGQQAIPNGAIVIDALLDVETALTGGTVTDTIQLDANASADLQAAAARNAQPWVTTGPKHITLTATSVPVKCLADRIPALTINGTAITAGKFRLIVWFVEIA